MTKLTREDIAISIKVVPSLSNKFTIQNVAFFCLFVFSLREIQNVVFTTMYRGNQDDVITWTPYGYWKKELSK